MTVEYPDADAEMARVFKAAWDSGTPAVAGYIPNVEWYGLETPDKVDRSQFWARFSTQHIYDEQSTLSDYVAEPFRKRYTGSGLVFIQLFMPKTIDNAVIKGRRLAKVARNAFRGKKTPGGIWFRNARINDVPAEDLFYRLNVVTEYEFDEIG